MFHNNCPLLLRNKQIIERLKKVAGDAMPADEKKHLQDRAAAATALEQVWYPDVIRVCKKSKALLCAPLRPGNDPPWIPLYRAPVLVYFFIDVDKFLQTCIIYDFVELHSIGKCAKTATASDT